MKCVKCWSDFVLIVDEAVNNLCPRCSLWKLGFIIPKTTSTGRIPVALQYDIAEYCEGFEGPCFETDTQVKPAMTAYSWDGVGEDPNRSLILCDRCADAYYDHWQYMWDEYYSGLL